MKLELRVGDKKLIEPEFELYSYNEQPDLLIVDVKRIRKDRKTEIEDSIDSNNYNITIENGVLGFEVEDVIYSFNLSRHIKILFIDKGKVISIYHLFF